MPHSYSGYPAVGHRHIKTKGLAWVIREGITFLKQKGIIFLFLG